MCYVDIHRVIWGNQLVEDYRARRASLLYFECVRFFDV